VHDLAVVVVAIPNEAHWIRPCLRSVGEHAGGGITLEAIVADNRTPGVAEIVEDEFPWARVVQCDNRGFGHANNRALATCNARYVLFLNPDTEILEGTLEQLVEFLDRNTEFGLIGVRQVTSDGSVYTTIRRFPSARRAFADAVALHRWAPYAGRLGERVVDMNAYDHETRCDWTTGSFMLVRREAIQSSGIFDERFFIYSEEADLCYRLKRAGWEIGHVPTMTILHYADKSPDNPRRRAQDAFSRLQYSHKHFSRAHRFFYRSALAIRYALRTLSPDSNRRAASRAGLTITLGLADPPFGAPPLQAVTLRDDDRRGPPTAVRLVQVACTAEATPVVDSLVDRH
jgi:N-acetylglucosaminyl-diphospho-decaprenol L-rhamnosyltransferase